MCFSPSTAASKAHTIVDCLAVGQSIDGNTDERVVLFVQLMEGELLSADLEKLIKTEVRARRSPRHVPSKVRATKILVNAIQHWLTGIANIDRSGSGHSLHFERKTCGSTSQEGEHDQLVLQRVLDSQTLFISLSTAPQFRA